MHDACGKPKVLLRGLQDLDVRLKSNSEELRSHIATAIETGDDNVINDHVASLSNRVAKAMKQVQTEPSHQDIHYVSRFDAAGLFQSVLATVFGNIPELQGYGDKNPIWVTTLIEGLAHEVLYFFQKVYQDVNGKKQPLWASLISELVLLPKEGFKAPFPLGIPKPLPLPEKVPIALLGDWGGDNDAAKNIAGIVRELNVSIGIHLGDIYYGGTEPECESFLRLWPLRDERSSLLAPPPGTSFALNGNHEMYCGGQYYFDVVLKAFNQPQSFFCLENEHWRLIGLDTAYANGSLKPISATDPISSQWNWLVDLLRNRNGKANILLTHHQPVSAHTPEFNDSLKLRTDIEELLAMDGVGNDAIFGWFFGHEHRCALYRDTATKYNARLIGNGCIPHLVQTEHAADEGCTPVDFFNKQEAKADPNAAVSSYAQLAFYGPELRIDYFNEDKGTFGTEIWSTEKGRLNGTRFIEYNRTKQ